MLTIDNWVMSCRVFGRQLEIEALNIVVEEARRRGIFGQFMPITFRRKRTTS